MSIDINQIMTERKTTETIIAYFQGSFRSPG